MKRKALLAVALAGMLALAGCGGTSGTTTQSPTQTTAQTTTQASVDYPPGVTASGVESGFELTGAHADALRAQNYTVTQVTTITLANGSTYETYSQSTNWASTEVFTARSYGTTAPGTTYDTIKAWTNGSTVAFQRSTVENQSSTVSHVSGGVGEISIVRTPGQWKEYLYTVVASGDMTVEQTEDGFVLTPAGDFTVTTEYGEVTPQTLEVTVTSEGVIKSVDFVFQTTIDGKEVTVEKSINFLIGGTTVDKPAWA